MGEYPCAYCGKTMQRYGGGPNIDYAECWSCVVKRLVKQRDELQRRLDAYALAVLGAVSIGSILWGSG